MNRIGHSKAGQISGKPVEFKDAWRRGGRPKPTVEKKTPKKNSDLKRQGFSGAFPLIRYRQRSQDSQSREGTRKNRGPEIQKGGGVGKLWRLSNSQRARKDILKRGK